MEYHVFIKAFIRTKYDHTPHKLNGGKPKIK